MPGVLRTRSLVCKQKTHELVTTGPPKQSGTPCAMVLTAYFVLFPVNRAFLPPSPLRSVCFSRA